MFSIDRKVNSVEVCIATMNNTLSNEQMFEKMNLQTDVIIGNQCDQYKFVCSKVGFHNVKRIDTAERGVGLNRNNAWMRSSADIVLFADDDMRYYDGYERVVLKLFNTNPKADIIVFNIDERQSSRKRTIRAHYTKKTGYGAVRIAVRRLSAQMHGISFNLHFGGGTEYSFGEDSLFLSKCIKEGLHVLVVPESIAYLEDGRDSTWFKGYNDKYYFDTGVLLAACEVKFPVLKLLIKRFRMKKNEKTNRLGVHEIKKILEGIKHYTNF